MIANGTRPAIRSAAHPATGDDSVFVSGFLFRETTGKTYLGPSIAGNYEPTAARIGVVYRRGRDHLLDTSAKIYYRHAAAPFTNWSAPVEVLAVAGRDVRCGYPSEIGGNLYVTYWTNNGTSCVAGIRRSTDGGATWADFATLPANGNLTAATSDAVFAATASRWFVAGYRAPDLDQATYNDYAGYWVSNDSGATWAWVTLQTVTNGGNEANIRRMPDGSLVYSARTTSIAPHLQQWRSWDSGATWHERTYSPIKSWADSGTLGQCQPDIARIGGAHVSFVRVDNSTDRRLVLTKSDNFGEGWDEIYRAPDGTGDFMYGGWIRVSGESAARLLYSEETGGGSSTDVKIATVRTTGTIPTPPAIATAVCAIWDAPASGAVSAVTDNGSGAHTIAPTGLTGSSSGLKSRAYEFASTGKFTIGTTASLNLLHDGSKFTAMWLVRSPVRQGIFPLWNSNGLSSSSNGMCLTMDHRTATGDKRQLRWVLRKNAALSTINTPNSYMDYAWRDNEWLVVTLIQKGTAAVGSWEIYLNDRLVASPVSSALAATLGASAQAPIIGQYSTISSTGNLRRFAVFDRVLSAAELSAMRAAMWEDLTIDQS